MEPFCLPSVLAAWTSFWRWWCIRSFSYPGAGFNSNVQRRHILFWWKWYVMHIWTKSEKGEWSDRKSRSWLLCQLGGVESADRWDRRRYLSSAQSWPNCTVSATSDSLPAWLSDLCDFEKGPAGAVWFTHVKFSGIWTWQSVHFHPGTFKELKRQILRW